MWWTMLFLLAALLLLSTVNGSPVRMPQNITCYNSSDPAALKASQLYDKRSDTGEFWNRDDLQKPLPPCSDITDALSDGRCEVCRDEQVFAVCQGLSESVDLRMEGSREIKISRCVCDQLIQKAETPTPALTAAPTTDPTAAPTALTVVVSIIITFLVVGLVAGLAVSLITNRRKRQSEDEQDPEAAAMKPLNGGQPTDVTTVNEIPNGRG